MDLRRQSHKTHHNFFLFNQRDVVLET